MSTKITNLKKPTLNDSAVLAFAEGSMKRESAATKGKVAAKSENAPKGQKSGLVPTGDVRLTVNIRDDLHQRLKIRAVQERTTVGELIEQWIEGWH
ncbi:hypothetical protein ACFPOE_18960 [Caenimonas terrae]|uniref:Chromosome partitioning protein ParB n=1 Tax=Caenimonas terrae TaxID=696074 RepID=A0ABW0NI07_9BURK